MQIASHGVLPSGNLINQINELRTGLLFNLILVKLMSQRLCSSDCDETVRVDAISCALNNFLLFSLNIISHLLQDTI